MRAIQKRFLLQLRNVRNWTGESANIKPIRRQQYHGPKCVIVFAKERSEGSTDAGSGPRWQHAIQWYDERDLELGNDFLGKLNECITSIEKKPEQFPMVYQQMRRALVKRFPYQVLYEIETEEIVIYAIYHCARDPQEWKRRIDEHTFFDSSSPSF